jgi:DNA-binding CsgD family transcriptional regulator
MAAQGMSSRRIADKLGVSVRTVDNQLGRVYTKLAVSGRRELAEMVDRLGS